ncbi:helix-turn-helix transcriptional regulator [Micromonospora sagamiensis]|uniref:helix-turn-helix transcriptional regulator n=1 Tax=Micromonospora sagamiensis TaxID=47875 RepID=UPI001680C7A3|nr:AraC family transcriptional regulator [Micromonospora sagamiensis]
MPERPDVHVWSPSIGGITEVLHARFTRHAYPMHLHDTWALLVVDDGAVRYDLDGREHDAFRQVVTLLPPHVPHNGAPVTPEGFRKRVLYLDSSYLDDRLVGPAVSRPRLVDPVLWRRIDLLHDLLAEPGDDLAAETHLALVAERLRMHLERRTSPAPATPHDPRVARRLRTLLDERVVEGVSLHEASRALHVNATYLVRAFSREYGIGPHQYVISRRVDLARGLLRDGLPAGQAAAAVGFYDQSHLNRHFKRILGFNPGRYGPVARTSTRARRAPAPGPPGRGRGGRTVPPPPAARRPP